MLTETGMAVIITSTLTGITALVVALKKGVVKCSCLGCTCEQTVEAKPPNSDRSATTKKIDMMADAINKMREKLSPRKQNELPNPQKKEENNKEIVSFELKETEPRAIQKTKSSFN